MEVGVGHDHGAREPKDEELHLPSGHPWHRIPRICAIVGGLALAASAVLGFGGDSRQLCFSYLVAFMYFLSLALGGLFFVLVQHASRAGWSVVVRRIAENVMGTIPVMAVLFLPVLFGVGRLYEWSHAEAVAQDPVLLGKAGYLGVTFFGLRAAIFIGTWVYMARWFLRRSVDQDETGQASITQRLQRASAPALVVFALTLTFASFDWMMSLDPHWYSTMFGVYYFSGCLVAISALMCVVVTRMRRRGLLENIVTVEHQHDLGKLVFAFTVFWAYVGFCQYMLIWYANLPEETVWYAHRLQGAWGALGLTLMAGHFGVPFLLLISRRIKRTNGGLAAAAVWLLAMHYLDLYYVIMPVLHHDVHPHILDLTSFVGVGAAFWWGFARLTARHCLIPRGDPRLRESLSFENS
jgi:hypothetical protein